MMNCELLATCSALGYLEGDNYHKEPDCLESIKDLIRYLRHEDETRDIRQQLGAAQILQNDLLPIIAQYPQEKLLYEAVIRLLVNLTQPALLCFGKVPDNPTFRHHFMQTVSYLQGYKEAFADEKVFGVLSEKLYDLLQLDWEQRQEEDNLLIERILLLVRNVLHVPYDPEEEKKNIDDDANVHDKVLWAMHMSGMDDLIKFLATSQEEQQWAMHILEIISLMFRDQKPDQLATTGQAKTVKEKENESRELEILKQRELAAKKKRTFERGTRHSRFGGTYLIQGLKSIADRDVVCHMGVHKLKNYSHDSGKKINRVPKRKQAAKEVEGKRRSALNVRLFLKEFCVDFLENCYNRLMYVVKDNLIREKAQQFDETYYLWAMPFFMEFNRVYRFRPELVSETVSIRAFHFVERNITNYYEMMLTDKAAASSWSRRMHLALKAYQELLNTINEMDHSKDGNLRESSRVIKCNIFYVMEFRELFLTLFRKYDATKQPKSFLKDLIETTHLFIRMIEKFCKGQNNLFVQKKKVKRKKPKAKQLASTSTEKSQEELEEMWKLTLEQLGKYTEDQEPLPDDVVPFDAALEIPVEEQRAEAMIRIQDALLAGKAAEALVLLRAAREVWPEGDVFGSSDLRLEDESQLLRQLLFAKLPRQPAVEAVETDEFRDEEIEEEETESVRVRESEFNFLDYLKRFANAGVVKPYILLLKDYRQNSIHTNHCIVKMLYRVAYHLKMDTLLYQLSVFYLFNHILEDPAASSYQELVKFCKYVLNRFFTLAAKNGKAYVELLFWKNIATIREMTEGYRKDDQSGESKRAPTWSSEEEEELETLYLRFKEEEGDKDVIDNIMEHIKNDLRTRKQIAAKLVQMNLVDSVRDLKRAKKGTKIVLWREEQEMELETLFVKFRGSDDVLGNIMKNITCKRSRPRVIDKLISMGLVSDRKELYKKRRKLTKAANQEEEEDFLNDLGYDAVQGSSEVEDELDEDDSSEDERGELMIKPTSRYAAKGDGQKMGESEPDPAIPGLCCKLQQQGLSGPLLWLQNCLNRTADKREDDGTSIAVPLVPLSEENEDAMEHEVFQKLLKKVGIRPPADEQESFWRISANLNVQQLRKITSVIALQDGGGEAVERDEDVIADQRSEVLRTLVMAREKNATLTKGGDDESEERTRRAHESTSGSDSDTKSYGEKTKPKHLLKRTRLLDSDDEMDDRDEETVEVEAMEDPDTDSEGSDSKVTHRLIKRRRRAIDDDDEED
ncbi:protein timeless homolog isoform X1 [Carcharodon carcharias]|uniref:protein timeless homolog isoform X1 n=1 Tax=Carcharodon carcharias TaxID=13397 RepID=UPI001B7DBEB5|nr:protein timeless homolog isoform X1 [Carcharodon carcharias]XP_041036138.1 protein timeless homolog isoform X1 [Carcharodon carcharias]XP_041036139.1 protein timeless homolog isoform X1 [Carcharodon carcharias]